MSMSDSTVIGAPLMTPESPVSRPATKLVPVTRYVKLCGSTSNAVWKDLRVVMSVGQVKTVVPATQIAKPDTEVSEAAAKLLVADGHLAYCNADGSAINTVAPEAPGNAA